MTFQTAFTRLLAPILLLVALGLSGPAQAAGEPLVVYSARKYQLVEQLFLEYGRERGIEVKSVTDDGAPLIQRLIPEGANSPADVFISVDAGDLWSAAEAGLLAPVKSPALEAAIPAHLRDPAGRWVGLAGRALGLHLEILEDPGGELTIDQVSSPEFDSQFVPSQVDAPNYGFSASAYWVRFGLDNETRRTVDWLLEVDFANMHYVDLYAPLPDGEGFEVKQTGQLRPVSTRDVLNPNIIFNLFVPPLSQQITYLRFKNGASMTLALTLWTKDAFLIDAERDHLLHGLFYGVLICLLIYNLFLLFSFRESRHFPKKILKPVAGLSPQLALKSHRLKDRGLHRKWIGLFRENIQAHRLLPDPATVEWRAPFGEKKINGRLERG